MSSQAEPEKPVKPLVCAKFDRLGADGAPCKLGVLGGTFDPIHVGHMAMAHQLREALGLDGVVFMVAGDPWMKQGRKLASAQDRFNMVQLACADNPYFDASRLEIDRVGKTYTVDTLRQLREIYPENVELYFLVSSDAFVQMPQWHDCEQLGSLANIAFNVRPGHDISQDQISRVRSCIGDVHAQVVDIVSLDISSTQVRAKLQAAQSVRYLVPDAVAAYIESHNLYQPQNG